MNDQQLAAQLRDIGWKWFGLAGDLMLSPDSQTITSVRQAARMAGLLDANKGAHRDYEVVSPKEG
jgi:hypothetical protein